MRKQEEIGPPEIEVLPGLEAVRRRPGMYVGDAHDGSDLHHLIWEVVGNVIDLHLARRVAALRITVVDGVVEVEDDGPGMAASIDPTADLRELQVIATQLHGRPTWDGHPSHTHLAGGFHGVGLAAVNALSEEFELETRVRHRAYRLRCRRGILLEPAHENASSLAAGTRVRFRPDASIFGGLHFDLQGIAVRLHELAYLCPALTIVFNGQTFREHAGLRGWVEARLPGPVFSASGTVREIEVDLALGFGNLDATGPSGAIGDSPRVISFAGMSPTRGGSHVEGLWEGLHTALGPSIDRSALQPTLGRHLVAALNVGLRRPRFGSPTRELLENREALGAVKSLIAERLPLWLERAPELARRLHILLGA